MIFSTGTKIGTVVTIIANESIKHPKNKYMAIITKTMLEGLRSLVAAACAIADETPSEPNAN
jgi:hypothetical protein